MTEQEYDAAEAEIRRWEDEERAKTKAMLLEEPEKLTSRLQDLLTRDGIYSLQLAALNREHLIAARRAAASGHLVVDCHERIMEAAHAAVRKGFTLK